MFNSYHLEGFLRFSLYGIYTFIYVLYKYISFLRTIRTSIESREFSQSKQEVPILEGFIFKKESSKETPL